MPYMMHFHPAQKFVFQKAHKCNAIVAGGKKRGPFLLSFSQVESGNSSKLWILKTPVKTKTIAFLLCSFGLSLSSESMG